MKILKRTKKGFTLVELIVVIAIVAILAAVSVVSYLAFINQANESADVQLVKQLNTALIADETLNGPRDTMHEMLGAMEENGFVVENLTKTKSGYDIVWDQNANRFALLDNKENLIYGEDSYNNSKKLQVWKFADTIEEATNKEYSVYLTEEFAKLGETTLEVNVGLDVGNYNKLTSISYKNTTNSEQKVVIRTNGGKLTVNAPVDTIKHYGYAEALDIQAIAGTSYHEFGKLGYANMANGRLVIEENAEIDGIYLVATNGDFNNIKLAVVGNATLPVIGRADVTLDEGESKLVVEIQTLQSSEDTDSDPEYVWISKSGSVVSSVVSSSKDVENYSENIIDNPSQSAAAAKEETTQSSTPISDDSVARIGATGYDSFKSAYDAAVSGNTIVLLKYISLTNSTGINKNIRVDLNGKKITSSAVLFNMYSNYELTITDSSVDKSGEIDVSADKIIYVSSGKFILESGTLSVHSSSTFTYGVHVGSSGKFEMKGGSIRIPESSTSTYNYCISNNGSTLISGGTMVAKASGGNYAVSNSSSGATMVITDCVVDAYAYPAGFKSPYVLYITSGTCTVTGGYFRAFGDSGSYSAGYLVDGSGSVSISGGHFGGIYYYGIGNKYIASGYKLIEKTTVVDNYRFEVVKDAE